MVLKNTISNLLGLFITSEIEMKDARSISWYEEAWNAAPLQNKVPRNIIIMVSLGSLSLPGIDLLRISLT
jgi:hypothetical protein